MLNAVMLSVVAPEEHLGLVACTDNANQGLCHKHITIII
jgi:hypothetical protein